MQFIDLQAQYQAYRPAIDAAIQEVLESARFIQGPQVKELEEALATYVGCEHAVGFASGTDSLLACLMAWDIGPGDEVITTPFTFVASAEVIALVGARPVFVDVEPDTLNLDPALLAAAITPRTRAIIPVSLFGHCAELEAIQRMADQHGLHCLEDACQSFGSQSHGRRSGSITEAAATSFFPAKPFGCYGDGGMAFTRDAGLADQLRIIREHGQTMRYQHTRVGINGRLDTLQAAILLAKFPHYEEEIRQRQQVARRYREQLAGVVDLPMVRQGHVSVYSQFTVRVANREQVVGQLTEAGIPTAIHYPIPLHRQKVFQVLNYPAEAFPVASEAAGKVLSLPMHPFLQENDQDRVIAALTRAVGQ